jgi:hypothetical protein
MLFVCAPDLTGKLPCVLIDPFASATDHTTVSAAGEFVVMASLKGALFWKTRRPSVVGVSALINPLPEPPAVCVGEPHVMADVLGVGVDVDGVVVAGAVVAGAVGAGVAVTGVVVAGGLGAGAGVLGAGVLGAGVVVAGGVVADARLTQHDLP